MKAITIMQPFATLITIGEKHFKTVNWKTDYRGDLLIHAGKGKKYTYLEDKEPFKSILEHYGYNKITNGWFPNSIPEGRIIAKVTLIDCVQITKQTDFSVTLEDGTKIKDNEFIFDSYTVGKYILKLANIKKLDCGVWWNGRQKLWNIDESIYQKKSKEMIEIFGKTS